MEENKITEYEYRNIKGLYQKEDEFNFTHNLRGKILIHQDLSYSSEFATNPSSTWKFEFDRKIPPHHNSSQIIGIREPVLLDRIIKTEEYLLNLKEKSKQDGIEQLRQRGIIK